MIPEPLLDGRAVLPRYPGAVMGLAWVRLGAAGGFSGATIWRGEFNGQPALALKVWPAGYSAGRLAGVHHRMRAARNAGLDFVPAVVATRGGESVIESGGRVWDVTAWRPGIADFHQAPSDAKLSAACAALAALHRAWQPAAPSFAPCPAVRRRLAVFAEFANQGVEVDANAGSLLRRAVALLPVRVADACALLRPWVDRPAALGPCLCDVWHDHVLFEGDRVTGVIDYGALKLDHPAIDLARLLGDFVDGDPERVRFGLAAYQAAGAPVQVDAELVLRLDWAGVVGAVLHWVRRVSAGEVLNDAATRRFERLVARLAAPPVALQREWLNGVSANAARL
jgi:homoserine kinase type II